MNVLILSKNFESYSSGYYHNDIVEAWRKTHRCFVYGPGYADYDKATSVAEIYAKAVLALGSIDILVCSTSWDDDESKISVNPNPAIKLEELKGVKKIYYLNKEYKKIDLRLEYIKKSRFDYVLTVHPDYQDWERFTGVKFIKTHFAVNLDRFGYDGCDKTMDFGFTGSLHQTHTDLRYSAKSEIFKKLKINLKSNISLLRCTKRKVLIDELEPYKVYWAEFGAKDLFRRSLLPFGEAYENFLKKFKVFLNTPSAIGIFNTRFFELMASKTLILCPANQNYQGILLHGLNCIQYEQGRLVATLRELLDDDDLRLEISQNAYDLVTENHTYEQRVREICKQIL